LNAWADAIKKDLVSDEMKQALKARGCHAPPGTKRSVFARAPPVGKVITKEAALKAIRAGDDIPAELQQVMKEVGWTGNCFGKQHKRGLENEELYVRDFEDLQARDIDLDPREFDDLYARDFEGIDNFEY
jgi:hypothetical protein